MQAKLLQVNAQIFIYLNFPHWGMNKVFFYSILFYSIGLLVHSSGRHGVFRPCAVSFNHEGSFSFFTLMVKLVNIIDRSLK